MKLGTVTKLDKSGSRILGAYSVKLTFSLRNPFYLTKTENRTKKSLKQLSHYCFEVLFLPKNADFCKKNDDNSKIRRTLVLKGIFYYICVCTYAPNFKFLA